MGQLKNKVLGWLFLNLTGDFDIAILKPTKLVGFMLKILTKSQYGLRAMIYLAKSKNEPSSLKEISKKEGIPFDYLEKIIAKLKRAGFLKAKKGVQGGYFLIQKPSKIKVGGIIRALEEETPLVKCLKYFCPKAKKCLAKNFWKKLNRTINSALNSMTLADLVKDK